MIDKFFKLPLELKLNPSEKEKLERLAEIRCETVEQVLCKLNKKVLRKIPSKFGKSTIIPIGFKFADAGISEGMAYVKLQNGRIFYGHTSTESNRKVYEVLKDKVCPKLTADTYRLAMDVSCRYLGGHDGKFGWYREELLPEKGGVVVEVGAYLGHKTIRFHDQIVGNNGKILAIELVPKNFRILQRNIRENNLNNSIDVILSGVWNTSGEHIVRGKGFQRNTLVELDARDFPAIATVPTDTLDNILQKWGVEPVDFLDIRVNGAEIEALEGLDRTLNRVKVIFVAARYHRDGKSTHERCLKILKDRGCTILPQTGKRAIYAVTEKFSKDFV